MAPSNNATSPHPQNATTVTPFQNAVETLKSALDHMRELYKIAADKVNKGQDPDSTFVEVPYRVYEDIGNKIHEAHKSLSQYKSPMEEIGEHFARLEKSLMESITTATTRPYAQVAATPTTEANRASSVTWNASTTRPKRKQTQCHP